MIRIHPHGSLGGCRLPALIAGLAAGLSACGSNLPAPASPAPTNLPNIAQIQSAIGQSVLARLRLHVTVTCPRVVPEIRGETFACVAVARGANRRVMMFLVTEQAGTYVSYRQTG